MTGTPRRERGASAVEAALVTPVVLALMLGILELGLYFKDALSTSDATKAGVRIASAERRPGPRAWRGTRSASSSDGARLP